MGRRKKEIMINNNKEIDIIQVVQHLNPGGLEVMALNLLDTYPDPKKVMIVSLEGDKDSTLRRWKRLNAYKDSIVFLNKKSGICINSFFKLTVLFLKYRPKAIHTHHIGPLFYAGWAAKILGVKNIVHTEHDAWYLSDPKAQKLQNKLIQSIRPKLVAVSSIVAQQLENKCQNYKISIIPNGIDMNNFKPMPKPISRKLLGLPLNKHLIGTAGRLVTVKGHRYLIESLKHLSTDIHLAIAGDGELREELEDLTRLLNLDRRVHFLGHTDDMKVFYNAIDIFCLPSLNEGLPLTLLEAQSCNTPCISSDVGGCHEVISKKSGFLTTPRDVKHLYTKISEAFTEMHNFQPRNFVREYGDLHKMALAYFDLYQNQQCKKMGEI